MRRSDTPRDEPGVRILWHYSFKEGAMDVVGRAKAMLLTPQQEWQVIATEATTVPDLYRNYIALLAAIGPVASVIGMAIVGMRLPGIGSFRVPITSAIGSAIVQYVVTLVAVYVLALVIDALAPRFSAKKGMDQAFKLAAYASTPAWLAGVFMLIPALSMLGVLGLYSLYLLYLGLPALMKCPEDRSLGYTAAVVVAAVVLFVIAGILSRAFVPYPSLIR